MAPSDTPQGPSADVCDHHYETRTKGGEPIAVRVCTLCHRPDWADLAAQASNIYQLGWEASTATGSDPLEFVPPTARDLPKDALDSATRGADMRDSRAYTAEGRNFLAHALLQLHRDGWLRDEAQPPDVPIPENGEPEPTPASDDSAALVLDRRLKLAHQQRRAKEAQLDGIRRALLDTGVIQEDDRYSHADLEDAIRQTIPEIERLTGELNEARMWARHGYEIGQRHCGWADHGVTPAWLTDDWPHHFDSCEHLAKAADLDARLAKEHAALNQIRELAERWKYTGDRKEGPLRELLSALGEDQR
ncbi:hypothetical protein [Streptomyces asiaticus]|uniref:hypothetical protein n=1 Tax=Streptomyces asiaticus TaxID=114695 RepID=UPI003809CCAC